MPVKFRERTNQQNAAFHRLIGSRGLTNEDKSELVFDITNGRTESSKSMSFDEMNFAIKKLGGTEFSSRLKRKTTFYPKSKSNIVLIDPISPEALFTLNEYRQKLPRLIADDAFCKLCKTVIKKPFPTRVGDGQKMIECLKSMSRRAAKLEVA